MKPIIRARKAHGGGYRLIVECAGPEEDVTEYQFPAWHTALEAIRSGVAMIQQWNPQ
tara:strand:- start:8 stop:178 length:171 start_codon:yes stop_codon:yes gene_type:complete